MFTVHRALGRLGSALLLCTALAACTSLQPYRVPVVQGNVVTREQVAVLRPGMSRFQVRDILGTPLLASVFHADRWDYVFTLKRQGLAPQARRVTVYFQDGVLSRHEADELPSETEFVSTLGRKDKPKVPVLEASAEKLAQFPPPVRTEPQPLPPLPTSYPPLEPANR